MQAFRDPVNLIPHLQVLAADGTLLPNARHVVRLRVPAGLLSEDFWRAVLDFPSENRVVSEELRARMLARR